MVKKLEIELKVGLFVAIGTGLLMVAILALGSAENLFSSNNRYTAHFAAVDGLIPGAKVVLSGLTVGSVEEIDLDRASQNIIVRFTVAKKYSDWIRKDSFTEIATQGVLGDKYVTLIAGTPDQPEMPVGSDIPNRPTKDLSQFLSRGDQLLVSLNSISGSLDRLLKTLESKGRSEQLFSGLADTAKNLSGVTQKLNDPKIQGILKNLHGILEKINAGTGTVGALINDPGLYDDAKNLVGGANRNRILRNLVRQTVKDGQEADAEGPAPQPKKK